MAKKNKNKSQRKLPEKFSNAFVVGNGTSRKDLDLQQLLPHGNLYGCNWFFRDEFMPDVIVASDEPMTKSITKAHSAAVRQRQFYTWFPKPGSGAKKASCPEKFAAGPMATWVACREHEAHDVFLIGMDFFGFGSKDVENNGKINNLYAGEKHYTNQDIAPTYRNWQRRFQYTMKMFPNVKFWHVNPFEGKSPERLRGLPNFNQVTWENVIDHFENGAELVNILERTDEDIQLAMEPNVYDLKAIIERQIVGQENVVFQDLMSTKQVVQIRQTVNDIQNKNPTGGGAVVNILGQEVMIPFAQYAPGQPAPTKDQIRAVVEREQLQRQATMVRYCERFNYRPIQFPITQEMIDAGNKQKEQQMPMTPPPPPPLMGAAAPAIPPPPPPVFQ